jgi:hypothetical protein
MEENRILSYIESFYKYIEQFDEVMFADIRKHVISSPSDKKLLNLISFVQEKPYIFTYEDHYELDTHDREPKHRIEKLRDFIPDLENKCSKLKKDLLEAEKSLRGDKTQLYQAVLIKYHNLVNITCQILESYDHPVPKLSIRKSKKKSSIIELVYSFYTYLEKISKNSKRYSPITQRCCFSKQDIRKNVANSPTDKKIWDIVLDIQDRPYIYIKTLGESKYIHLKLSTEHRNPKKRYYQIREIVNIFKSKDKRLWSKYQILARSNSKENIWQYQEIINSYQRLFSSNNIRLEKLRAQRAKR